MTATNKQKYRPALILLTVINLLISGCWVAVPKFMYSDSEDILGEPYHHPMLEILRPYFYLAGFCYLIFTWIFWRGSKRMLLLPMIFHGLLVAFLIWSSVYVFETNLKQGLTVAAVTILPPLGALILIFLEWRRRSLVSV